MNADLKTLRDEIARVLRKKQNILIKSKNALHEGVKYKLKDGSYEAGNLQDFMDRDRLALIDNKPQAINENMQLLNSLSSIGFKCFMVQGDNGVEDLKRHILAQASRVNIMIINSQNQNYSESLRVAQELDIPVIVWLKSGTAEIRLTAFPDIDSLNEAINEEKYQLEVKKRVPAFR